MPLLSVVIPVYNVETSLRTCVESVLNQNVEDMEIILVDDGSTDHSPDICHQLAEQDQRVRVLHKANGGLSDARNAGIDVATGQFLTFVDSDDWLAPHTYAPLLHILGQHPHCDMLEYAVRHMGQERVPVALANATYPTGRHYWLHTMAWQHAYAWNKIYRRHLFHHLRFARGKVFEDLYLLPLLLRRCGPVVTTSQGTYCYAVNPHGISITASATLGGLWQHLVALSLAAWRMRTLPTSRRHAQLHMAILYRLADIAKLLWKRAISHFHQTK